VSSYAARPIGNAPVDMCPNEQVETPIVELPTSWRSQQALHILLQCRVGSVLRWHLFQNRVRNDESHQAGLDLRLVRKQVRKLGCRY
jgi:hypothetical protein